MDFCTSLIGFFPQNFVARKKNAEDNEAKLEEMSRKLEELEKSRQEVCYCLPYVLHILHGFEGDMPEYLLEVTGKTRSGMSPDD